MTASSTEKNRTLSSLIRRKNGFLTMKRDTRSSDTCSIRRTMSSRPRSSPTRAPSVLWPRALGKRSISLARKRISPRSRCHSPVTPPRKSNSARPAAACRPTSRARSRSPGRWSGTGAWEKAAIWATSRKAPHVTARLTFPNAPRKSWMRTCRTSCVPAWRRPLMF